MRASRAPRRFIPRLEVRARRRARRELASRELLAQTLHQDRLVARLQVDRNDGDLVEVPALMPALLDVDVRLARGQRHLHGVRGWPAPVLGEVDTRVR